MKMRILGALLLALALWASAPPVGRALSPSPSTTGPSVAGKRSETFPMKVEDFLAGKYLLRSDVLLTRRDWDFWSYMIRWATTSPFSHAALVFTSPTQEVGINNTFVIEAGTSGVALTNLRDYINDKSEFVAIKRLKQPWWDEEKQNCIRGLLLDNIKSEYNYWAIVRVIRNIWFGVERSVRGRRHTIAEFEKRDWRRPNEFICSGLVQFGFVEGISEYVLARKLPPWALNDVVFGQDAERRLIGKGRWEQLKAELKPADYEALIDANIPAARGVLSQDLESITPEELSQSAKLEWQYVIKDGLVHKIASRADLDKFIK